MATLELLKDQSDLEAAEHKLRERFAATADVTDSFPMGFRGGQATGQVYWHESFDLWACLDEREAATPNRFWNAFGLGDPRTQTPTLVITCEINPARSGVNRRVAGAFARDAQTGRLLLLHRGKIGGGKPGVSQELFWEHYGGETVEVLEGDSATRFAVVADLEASDVVARVAAFVSDIAQFKTLAVPPSETNDPGLRQRVQSFMGGWVSATSESLRDHPIYRDLQILRDRLADRVELAETVHPDASVGSGAWAQVPWIAWLDERETTSTTEGVYPVYLFRADGSGVYVTLAQGVAKLEKEHGSVEASVLMRRRASELRGALADDLAGFDFDSPVDLHGTSALTRAYESSVIAHRFYPADSLPDDEKMVMDLQQLTDAYERWVSRPRAWIFQANPARYRLREALGKISKQSWMVSRYENEIAPGDRVYLWESGKERGIYAVAQVIEPTSIGPPVPADDPYRLDRKLNDDHARCVLSVEQVLTDRPILHPALMAAGLDELQVLRQPQGSNFRVSDEERRILDDLIGDQNMTPSQEVTKLEPPTAANLSAWLLSQGLRYSPELVATYLTALQTKGFVILSGISGTGKTKLAQRFADLVGDGDEGDEGNIAFLPVRPDWRDAKPILGYFNPLAERFEGTEVLRLLLRAGEFETITDWRQALGSTVRERKDWQARLSDLHERVVNRPAAQLTSEDLHRLWHENDNGIASTGQAPKLSVSDENLREISGILGDSSRGLGDRYIAALQRFTDLGVTKRPRLRTLRALAAFDPARVSTIADGRTLSKLAKHFGYEGPGVHKLTSQEDAEGLDTLFATVATGVREILGAESTDAERAIAPWVAHELIEGQAQSTAELTTSYFILLDEMNLARVEYYFADFLSVLESGRDEPKDGGYTKEALRLHGRLGGAEIVRDSASGDPIPPMLRIPPNVYVTGTINIDETTHAVSPKVLDRAFTIEVTADRFGSYAPTKEVGIDRDALRTAFQQDGAFLAGSERHLADLETDAPIYTQWLQRLSDALAPYDLHFGHRTYREILSFTGNAISAPWYDGFNRDRDRAFDAACLSKVLPKLSGGRQRAYDPLRIALAWAIDPDSPDEEAVTVGLQTMEWTPTSPRLAGTAGKALRMLRQSTRTGFASFA